jgi:hypothetical protein
MAILRVPMWLEELYTFDTIDTLWIGQGRHFRVTEIALSFLAISLAGFSVSGIMAVSKNGQV